MKTFETEKGNIPDGATHYLNETDTDCFAWYREDTKEVMVGGYVAPEWESAGKDENLADMKPIPQAKTETPGEKEVEWVNGDDVEAYGKLYKYVGLDPFNDNLCICLANQDDDPQCFSIEVLNKPETEAEAERVERERLEAAYDLYCTALSENKDEIKSFDHFKNYKYKCGWLAIVDKTNYRKEG